MPTDDIQQHRLIVLGSGPAGYTAALYASRANLNPVLITGVEVGGQLTTTTDVDNWPGDHDGLQGPELMLRMSEHVEKFGTTIVNDTINRVDFGARPLRLHGDATEYACDALIIATGASAKYLGLPSEEAYKGRGVSACATCDGFFFRGSRGRGNRRRQHGGRRSALPLEHRQSRTPGTPPRRASGRQDPPGPAIRTRRAGLREHYLESHLDRSRGGRTGGDRCTARTRQRRPEPELGVDGVFIAIGHVPNTGIFEGKLAMNEGYIRVDSGTQGNATATSVPGVFAAGDVADHVYRQAVTSAGFGCMAALDAEKYLDAMA